jgi:exonuclease SbcC
MLLQELEVTNFRSIKGRVIAPLDARIVLLHGDNGAGKTSLLSAIELALTERVLSLERADPAYQNQLLHWSSESGRVELTTDDGSSFETLISTSGASTSAILPKRMASFFSERCYLPQSLLGQLLQIYQASDEDMDSPLARFVGELLGLDRLDALDVGLRPLADLRNFRKIAEGYGGAEAEKAQLERRLADHHRNLEMIQRALDAALAELTAARATLELSGMVDERSLEQNAAELSTSPDEAALAAIADQRRQLDAIQREASRNRIALTQSEEVTLSASHLQALQALESWQANEQTRITAIRRRAEALLPAADLPSALDDFYKEAVQLLTAERNQVSERLARATKDSARGTAAAGELEVARKQLLIIEVELARIAPTSGDLGALLAEITSFIDGQICPVCDRDFTEVNAGFLTDHAHDKVRRLSSSAQRLLDLSRTRGQQQTKVEALEREIATLGSRILNAKALAELSRQAVGLDAILAELVAVAGSISNGAQLMRTETAARRALADFQSRSLARASLVNTLRDFASLTKQDVPAETEVAEAVIARLASSLDKRASALSERLAARRTALDAIRRAQAELVRRRELTAAIQSDGANLQRNMDALSRANALRAHGQTIRAKVEQVRSEIIRREFNERLNKLWRDLFVRLAPSEPFVPAFKIPENVALRLQPKLITEHRSGGAGGTPGAMLSAGNLNTAALTLFIALHLTVPAQLPWLILDDPIQSMDDVHIANLASLLRTLAKEHGRQIVIAVHDRQLFEYLKLELSPAYPEDSLLTLELSRGAHRDSLCTVDRRSYREETALRAAA